MGGKKKGKGGKGKKDQEEDLSTETLQRLFRKKLTEHGGKKSKSMDEFFEKYFEDGEHIKKVSESISKN